MENINILFWIVAIPTLLLLFSASGARGWIFKALAILAVLVCAAQLHRNWLIYVAAGLWGVFILLPNVLARPYNKYILEQDFASARRLARFISILHPFDGWLEQPRIVHAMELAQQGDTEAAVKILHEFQRIKSPMAFTAMVNLYRITHRWEEFVAWSELQSNQLETDASFFSTLLRARGEVGDLRGLVELYERNKHEIARMTAGNSDFCRLVLFAFTGRRDLVERLFSSSLSTLPEQTKKFWITTAELTAGKTELVRKDFENQLQTTDAWNRRAIERRLTKTLPTAGSLDSGHLRIVEDAATEHGHEQMFDAAPPLREAPVARMIILINLAVFAREITAGGATNPVTLIQMGAVFGDLVHQGQWWRLVAALFLHWGVLHIAMNMINLSVIGPFVENAYGSVKFVVLYFVAGAGSMFIVTTLSRHSLTVGASGAIMGLVGATGGLMLKGWLRHRAHPAKRRLRAIIMILAIQTMFDAIIPQVSMTAHLSGALIGFATAILLSSNLEPENA